MHHSFVVHMMYWLAKRGCCVFAVFFIHLFSGSDFITGKMRGLIENGGIKNKCCVVVSIPWGAREIDVKLR